MHNTYSTGPTKEGFKIKMDILLGTMNDAVSCMNVFAERITEELNQIEQK